MKRFLLALIPVVACSLTKASLAPQPLEPRSAASKPVSEVIAIKHELAAHIAAALNGGAIDRQAVAADFRGRVLRKVKCEILALGQRTIVPYERTNAVFVAASPTDLRTIKRIIEELDVEPPQLLIEGLVLELRRDTRNDASTKQPGCRRPTAPASGLDLLTNLGLFSLARCPSPSPPSGEDRPKPNELTYVATLAGDLNAGVSLLATNALRIVQRPRVQTSDGVEVMIPVQSSWAYSGYVWVPVRGWESGQVVVARCSLEQDRRILMSLDVVTVRNRSHPFGLDAAATAKTNQANTLFEINGGEIVMLGGLTQMVKEPLFSGVDFLDRVPPAAQLVNKLLTTPTHTVPYEIVVLIRPTVLPAPNECPR